MPCDVAAASPAGDALAPALLRKPGFGAPVVRRHGLEPAHAPCDGVLRGAIGCGGRLPVPSRPRPGAGWCARGLPGAWRGRSARTSDPLCPRGRRWRRCGVDAAAVTIDAGGEGPGIEGRHRGGGDVRISVRDSRVTTAGRVTETNTAHGIDAFARTGSVEVRLRDVEIEILGTGADDPADPDATAFAAGVAAARSEGSGRVAVVVAGGRIATRGRASRGIAVGGAGNVAIHIRGATVATPSPGSRRTSPRAEKRRSGARPVAALICSLGEGRICCVEAARWNQYGATLTSVTRNGS